MTCRRRRRAIASGLLVAFAPVVIAGGLVRDVRAEGAVSMRTLSGVLAIYLLLGMFYSFVDAAVAEIGSSPFFAGNAAPDRSDFLYFSYVTLSTVGYGDLVAATDVGRAVAVSEALLGQIYLVTVVALIVSNLRPGAAGGSASAASTPALTLGRARPAQDRPEHAVAEREDLPYRVAHLRRPSRKPTPAPSRNEIAMTRIRGVDQVPSSQLTSTSSKLRTANSTPSPASTRIATVRA